MFADVIGGLAATEELEDVPAAGAVEQIDTTKNSPAARHGTGRPATDRATSTEPARPRRAGTTRRDRRTR